MISFDVTRRFKKLRFLSTSPRHLNQDVDIEKIAYKRDIIKDNKRNQITFRPRVYSLRRVPAFTIQTQQWNTKPQTPTTFKNKQKQNKYSLMQLPLTQPDENLRKFLQLYEDRCFPIRIISINNKKKRQLEWDIDPNKINSHDRRELFKRFATGLAVEKEPYTFIAVQGFKDLLLTINSSHLIAELLNEVMPNIRQGLNSTKLFKKIEMLEILCQIVQLPGIGPLLVPYYRILLPPLRLIKNTRISTDISITDLDRFYQSIDKTLAMLEKKGGENSLINIKYLIPEYQSMYKM